LKANIVMRIIGSLILVCTTMENYQYLEYMFNAS